MTALSGNAMLCEGSTATRGKYAKNIRAAVSYLLASYLAGPVVKGKTAVQMAAAMRSGWERLAGAAMVTDANQFHFRTDFTPGSVRARSAGGPTRVIEQGQYRHSLPFWSE